MEKEARAIMEMYDGVKTAMRLENGKSEWFDVNVGVPRDQSTAVFHSLWCWTK